MIAILTSNNPFARFNAEHWTWLCFGILYIFTWVKIGKAQQNAAGQQRIAMIFTGLSIVTWMIAAYIHLFHDPMYYQKTNWNFALPFHLCYILNFLTLFVHIYRSEKLFNIVMLWLITTCFTPLLSVDPHVVAFPNYLNIRYFFIHITLVLQVFYGIMVYGFRPNKWTPLWAILACIGYYCFVHPINLYFGTNFMFTITPAEKSPLELLGDHWIAKTGFIAFFVFYLICAPFLLFKKQKS